MLDDFYPKHPREEDVRCAFLVRTLKVEAGGESPRPLALPSRWCSRRRSERASRRRSWPDCGTDAVAANVAHVAFRFRRLVDRVNAVRAVQHASSLNGRFRRLV
eukprot:4264372-Pleurochrysis_carterae.AAC.2